MSRHSVTHRPVSRPPAVDPKAPYDAEVANAIERRWQAYWRENRTFFAEARSDDAGSDKFYLLDMFIGPSGAMHVGHPVGYVGTEVYGRFKRMQGFNVMHTLGYDAFGLPAEQYAVRTGQNPAVTTEENIRTIRGQFRRLGMAHDPRRDVATTDVSFYRWTQWMFLRLFDSWYDETADRARPIAELERRPDIAAMPESQRRKVIDEHRLAYLAEVPVNWCPGLGTVLANEEVTNEGRSDRGNFPVFPRRMRQWMLRITAYARRLSEDLDLVDWPESVKTQQRNWIPEMRDWLFSRQRYWGEPFPIVYDEHGPIALPDSMLPLVLPETDDFSPRSYDPDDADSEPESPLSRLHDWVEVELDLGDGPKRYRRETNTMPQWAGSCWYEMRYLDPDNDEAFCSEENERYWMPADLYVGGGEHTVLHLLYARFWHKVLYDLGHVSTKEPFQRLFTIGYVQAYSYTDERGIHVPAEEVEEQDGGFFYHGRPVTRSLGKMGKSLRNIVTPDEICDRYGADTFRVYMMSAGPLNVARRWDPRGIVGAHRFLQRIWRLDVVDEPATEETRRLLHRTIRVVRQDMEQMAFNTAIARLIEFVAHLTALPVVRREAYEPLVLMIAPFAPHLAEELWARDHDDSLAYAPYPVEDPAYAVEETVTCVVQVDGRLRDRLEVAPSVPEDDLRGLASASERVRAALEGREVIRTVVRPPGLVNIVTVAK